jgi:hypothetical protein
MNFDSHASPVLVDDPHSRMFRKYGPRLTRSLKSLSQKRLNFRLESLIVDIARKTCSAA